jgi:hypothetical protein
MIAQSCRNGAFSVATHIAGAPAAGARTADVERDDSGLRFPSECALFPSAHNVLKLYAWARGSVLSFEQMQAYILA